MTGERERALLRDAADYIEAQERLLLLDLLDAASREEPTE